MTRNDSSKPIEGGPRIVGWQLAAKAGVAGALFEVQIGNHDGLPVLPDHSARVVRDKLGAVQADPDGGFAIWLRWAREALEKLIRHGPNLQSRDGQSMHGAGGQCRLGGPTLIPSRYNGNSA